MYVAIYGYGESNDRRKHLGNIRDIEYTETKRTYEFSSAEISGVCDFDIDDALIYTIHDDTGAQKSAGFVKNIQKLKGRAVRFKGDDFKRVLDTDVLIDYTRETAPSFTLQSIFNKVSNAVLASNRDNFMSKIELDFLIPIDETDTTNIADYTGQYLIVNAKNFLKVYMAYHEYYIKPSYDIMNDSIIFEFKKGETENPIKIKLKDFIHETTSSDIKVNKAIATISFDPSANSDPPTWSESDAQYYNSQPESNRTTMNQENTPSASGYNKGFALRLVTSESWQAWSNASESEYNSAQNKISRTIQKEADTCSVVTLSDAIDNIGSPDSYSEGTVVRFRYSIFYIDEVSGVGVIQVCNYSRYLKIDYDEESLAFYKLEELTFTRRPNLPEKVYLLGKDNRIYEGYDSITQENRIYPVVSKIHESRYLSVAQINAVYEIANSRYVENIIITTGRVIGPINLEPLELYTMIRVYDDKGTYKDIPLSEKETVYKSSGKYTQVKLGFKKTQLTEIIKNDIGALAPVKESKGGGSGTVEKAEIPMSNENDAPDPTKSNLWFALHE